MFMRGKILFSILFAVSSVLHVNAKGFPIGDFDSGDISPFYTWGAPLSIEANPDGTAEDSVALLDQSGGAWSGIASWWNDGDLFLNFDSLTVDVYANATGDIKFFAEGSISGAANFEKMINGVPAKTWTTYTVYASDLSAEDYKQFAIQYSVADSIFFDNFTIYGSTVVDVIVNSEDHTTLETAVVEAELDDDLSTEGPFTVFAPTDDAFAALGTVVDDLLADPTGELANILLYHVLGDKVMSTDLSDGMAATTLLGKDIEVTISGSDVFINDAQVTVANIEAYNGVVHVIDAVLTPPTTVVDLIAESADHTTLETAVVAAELDDDLNKTGPFTVFAPTDDAFAALGTVVDDLLDDPTGELAKILLYHVVAGKAMSIDLNDGQVITTLLDRDIEVTITGSDVFINDAQVTLADLEADNGVVHVIDAVLTPPRLTVVDIVVESEDHDTLESAVIAADLVETLNGDGPFTVFAPTDDAFAALPDGLLDDLLADPTGDLTDILLYHVVAAKAMSTDLSDGQVIETVLGKNITVTINNDGVFINDAQVTLADIETDNGVVHVIDAVLTPPPDIRVMEDEQLGKILTDHAGNTLYFFTKDAYDTSACVDGCLDNWPVFYAESPSLDSELNADDFGSIDRGNGVMQTTYKGWPLYYFVNDENPGDTNGEAVINSWFVAKPDYTIMLVDNQLTGNDGKNYKGDYTEGDEVIQYFTDGMGLTLYTWVNDNYLTNNFTNEDFSNDNVWPIYEEDTIVVPSILDPANFAFVDVYGKSQLAYKGWPLYYFGQDNMMRGSNKGVSVPSPGVWPVAVQDMMPPLYATVVDVVVNSPDHETLEAAVIAAGLVETLQGDGPFTVFAPTDAAFDLLPEGTLDDLLADPAGNLTDILLYHVVAAKAMSTDLSDGQKIETVFGDSLTVSITNDGVFINDAKVIVADIEAENGVVHVIDAVLMPELMPETVVDIIVDSEDHTTLEAAVLATAQAEMIEDFEDGSPDITVFGGIEGTPNEVIANPDQSGMNPSDSVVKFVKVEGAETWAGGFFEPGFVLDLDTYTRIKMKTWSPKAGIEVRFKVENQDNSVSLEVGDTTTVANAWEELEFDFSEVPEADYVRVVIFFDFGNTGDGTEYYYDDIRLGNTDLAATLQGEGPFTVFAPTDDAFAALPEGTLDDLLAEPGGDLTDILLYHVVAGKTMSADLSDGQEITTALGQDITISITNDGVFINDDVKVTVADIEAENGVVHVIDAVLMPDLRPATVVDIIADSPDHETLETAVGAAELVETLQGEGPFTVFAPTDAAFDALDEGVLDDLLADPTGDLADILLYHVVAAKAMSADLSDGQTITTQLGEDVTVTITGDDVFINDAQVTVADLEAQNGVVHVINAVLLPPTNVEDQEVGEMFKVYPNPAAHQVTLQINNAENFNGGSLEIIRIDGVIADKIEINNFTTIIDLNGYDAGVYYLRYSEGSNYAIEKLVIK